MPNPVNLSNSPIPKEQPVNKTLPISQHHINISDTTKPIKPNVKDDYNQNQSDQRFDGHQSLSARTRELLLQSQPMTQLIKRLFANANFEAMSSSSESAANQKAVLQQLFLPLQELPQLMEMQGKHNTIFSGAFFEFLQQILNKNPNNEPLKESITALLKQFDFTVNNNNSISFLINNLNTLLPNLSTENQQTVLSIIQQLSNTLIDNKPLLLENIKSTLMPIFNITVSQNQNNPHVRNIIMLSIHNLSRLELGDPALLRQSLDQLLRIATQYSQVRPDQVKFMQLAFEEALGNIEPKSLETMHPIIRALDQTLFASHDFSSQILANQLLQTFLLNNSVLLPLIYGFIPLQLEDRILFGEFWIDPNEKNATGGGEDTQTKVFFTIDSSQLGYFQGTLLLKDSKLSVLIEGPETAFSILEQLKTHMEQIVSKNGFTLQQMHISKMTTPKTFYQVFGPTILKEHGINVKI